MFLALQAPAPSQDSPRTRVDESGTAALETDEDEGNLSDTTEATDKQKDDPEPEPDFVSAPVEANTSRLPGIPADSAGASGVIPPSGQNTTHPGAGTYPAPGRDSAQPRTPGAQTGATPTDSQPRGASAQDAPPQNVALTLAPKPTTQVDVAGNPAASSTAQSTNTSTPSANFAASEAARTLQAQLQAEIGPDGKAASPALADTPSERPPPVPRTMHRTGQYSGMPPFGDADIRAATQSVAQPVAKQSSLSTTLGPSEDDAAILGVSQSLRDAAGMVSHTPGPTHHARADLARHVATQIVSANLTQNGGEVELRLNPEELGRVRVSLRPGDGAMLVTIVAERGETLDLMRRNIHLLAEEFQDLGYSDLQFDFASPGRGDEGARASSADPDDTPSPLTDPPAEALVPSARPASDGLDLRF